MRSSKGEQPAIPDRGLFDAVQTKLSAQATNHKTTRMKPKALLAGRISDDRGNRMSPPCARKRGVKYRYDLPSALMQGTAQRAESMRRAPAAEVEHMVFSSVRDHFEQSDPIDDRSLINNHVLLVEVQAQAVSYPIGCRPGPHFKNQPKPMASFISLAEGTVQAGSPDSRANIDRRGLLALLASAAASTSIPFSISGASNASLGASFVSHRRAVPRSSAIPD